MRAIVWRADGTLALSEERPEPRWADDEVLVRVRAAGVCTTDLHMVSGKLAFGRPPWVLGHEIAGTVERVGPRAAGDWQAGDRVVVDPVFGCGACRECRAGRKYLCASGGELGTTVDGGGYGQFVACKGENLYRLPDSLSFREGAMMEPLNCTLGAIARARNVAGGRVAVFGGGPAGLLFLQLAKAYGAVSVSLFDLREGPLALGRRLGADEASDPRVSPAEPDSFDVAIDAAGSVGAVQSCFEAVAPGGTVVLYGLNGSAEPSVRSDRIVGKDLTVVTCVSAPLLWDQGIGLVAGGRINVKDIVSHPLSWRDGAEFIARMARGEGERGIVKAMLTEEADE